MRHRCLARLWPLAAAALLALAPAEVSLAKLYKWVDENGNVTYSERKPPDRQVEEIRVRTAPAPPQAREKLDSMKDQAESREKDRDFAKTAGEDESRHVEQFKKNCEIARQNRRILENTSRIQDRDAEGNTYFLEPGQIQAKLAETNKQIELYCK